jgi:hypothetical protein
VQLDNIGAELLAKTLHPLVGKSADHNFVESTRFLGQMSAAAETKNSKMQNLAQRLTKITPGIRTRFSEITGVVGQRAALRGGSQALRLEARGDAAEGGSSADSEVSSDQLTLDQLHDSHAEARPRLELRR